MKWEFSQELTAKEKRVVSRLRRRSRFFVFLREVRHALFDEAFQEELSSVYAPRGQAPVPPAQLAMVTLLQAYTGVSDAEAVEAAEMDGRWQLVLGTLENEGAPFGQGSLVRFRARLVNAELDQRLVERTVELAKSTGTFGWKKLRVALDSSPLRGAGRVEDGWNLIGHAMNQLVVVLARLANTQPAKIVDEAGLDLLVGPSLKASLDIDWDDAGARSEALGRIVEQATSLIDWVRQELPQVVDDPAVQDALELLQLVINQNTEPDPSSPGGRRIRSGVPADRVCSVGDPEMRHGRKSRSKAFNGYKRHLATLVDAPLILAARVMPANRPESDAVPFLLDDIKLHGEMGELLIDRGYVSHERVSKLHREKVPIRCRPWPQNNRTGLFSKADFDIDLRRRQVTCPAGITVKYSATNGLAQFGTHCSPCSLREQCTTASKGRSVVVHPQEALLKKLRQGVATTRGRRTLRDRVHVEHRLARIQRSQGDKARYKGERMNTFDLRRHAAVANLLELRYAHAA